MQGLMFFSILLYVFTSGGRAMKFMFIMVRSLQMIIHLPMMLPLFPSNVIMIIYILIPTISFDFLNNFLDWESQDLMEFDFDKHDNIK